MCNLYHVAPENTLDSYIRRHLGAVKLPERYPPKPTVGPFDTGIFMTADDNGALVGRLGQWGMIRSGQRESSIRSALPQSPAASRDAIRC